MQRTIDAHAAWEACRELERQLTALRALIAPPAADAGTPEVSVAIPIFNEQDNIPDLYARLTKVLGAATRSFELVFVDDGSGDASRGMLTDLAAADARVVVVELSRNFGHQMAISAGLDYARGRAVMVMDADLQDPPEVLPRFVETWREGYDVVYGIRTGRKEARLLCWMYKLFYRILHRISRVQVPLDAGDFCLMDRRIVDLMGAMPERCRFVRGIRSWTGFRQTGLEYERQARQAGSTKYTFGRLIMLAFDGMVSLSHSPLRFASFAGGMVSVVAMLLATYYMIKRLFVGLQPPGFATLIVAILLLAGVQLLTIGVMGEYIGRIFDEVKGRPLYVVRKVTGGK